jgi:thymidine kinase
MLSAVLELDSEVVGVEETQFFGETILPVIEQMLEENRRVICAGLDLDAFERPFPPMPHLMALADRVDKLSAVCVKCGSEATRSQLLHLAEPAGEAWIELGGSEAYEARCRDCFEHPTGHIEAGSHQHVFIEEA